MKEAHEKLYNMISTTPFKCIEGCRDCCGFVVCSPYERSLQPEVQESKTIHCAFVKESGCQIYKDRPLLCRLFGNTQEMKCPHFDYTPEISQVEMVTILKLYSALVGKEPKLAKGSNNWQHIVDKAVKT